MAVRLTRREALRSGALAGAGLALSGLAGNVLEALASAPRCGTLADIEHIVIFIQENRSFDHYFGRFPGVKGFDDHPAGSPGVFAQPDPDDAAGDHSHLLLPYHLATNKPNLLKDAYCTSDITHSWAPQHQSWDGGRMDGFVRAHYAEDPKQYPLTMGYYDERDIPFFWAVARSFTLCDHYHCSVIGPTDPNRLYSLSATLDPSGAQGGPLLYTISDPVQRANQHFKWKTMPEVLEEHGISWKVYNSPDAALFNNVLEYFDAYKTPGPLAEKAFTYQFGGSVPTDSFLQDCLTGQLPQVSWILAPLVESEHPPAPANLGQDSLHHALDALTSNPSVWAKTALLFTYDENGGFFDHVPPPAAPPGTAGEYVTVPDLASVQDADGIRGPIGLGFRVPMLVVSPFSRGGFVASDVFDHTSTLKLIARRFGVTVPNLSGWRDTTVGDLTSAFNFARQDSSVPVLPATVTIDVAREAPVCLGNGGSTAGGPALFAFPPPNPQQMPSQEPGVATPPSGLSGCAVAGGAGGVTPSPAPGLPGTGARPAQPQWPLAWSGAAGALALGLLLRLRTRRLNR